MNTILIVSVLVAGIMQGPPQQLLSISPNCHNELLMLNAINQANEDNLIDVRYTAKCESK